MFLSLALTRCMYVCTYMDEVAYIITRLARRTKSKRDKMELMSCLYSTTTEDARTTYV
jgi:hypothetical protein